MGGGGGFEALQLYLFVLKRDKRVEYKNHQVLSLVVFFKGPPDSPRDIKKYFPFLLRRKSQCVAYLNFEQCYSSKYRLLAQAKQVSKTNRMKNSQEPYRASLSKYIAYYNLSPPVPVCVRMF